MITLLVILGVVILLILWAIGVYNSLIGKRNRVDNSWSQIDVQLKRRHDLIPNLVETVKGYAKHERETLEKVIQARNVAAQAKTVGEASKAEGQLSQALMNLFAVAEAYPDLKANQNFMQLQEELVSTENKVGFARQYYNDEVMTYNTAIQTIPNNIIAGFGKFEKREFFEIEVKEERQAPKVQF
ncbi:MAG: LemA family protein [Bacteroidetes bacterium]|nr:LemA family protein [Bacteroidota bacterium]